MVPLKILNYTVGATQLVLCAFLVAWLCTIDSDAASTLTFRIGEYNEPLSAGRDHGMVPVSTIVILLIVFTLITGLVHILVYARSTNWYDDAVNNGQNWVRWMEYAITATIMVVVIAVTCGTNSTDVLVLMGVATMCCMLCGYISETLADTHPSVSVVATIMGWLLLLTVFSLIIRRFTSIYSQSQGTDDGPPPWVWAIVITLTILFCVFGLIHLVHMWRRWRKQGVLSSFHRKIETSYTIASVVSKTLLVSMVAYGLFARTRTPPAPSKDLEP
jgi:hypothetical protein